MEGDFLRQRGKKRQRYENRREKKLNGQFKRSNTFIIGVLEKKEKK